MDHLLHKNQTGFRKKKSSVVFQILPLLQFIEEMWKYHKKLTLCFLCNAFNSVSRQSSKSSHFAAYPSPLWEAVQSVSTNWVLRDHGTVTPRRRSWLIYLIHSHHFRFRTVPSFSSLTNNRVYRFKPDAAEDTQHNNLTTLFFWWSSSGHWTIWWYWGCATVSWKRICSDWISFQCINSGYGP